MNTYLEGKQIGEDKNRSEEEKDRLEEEKEIIDKNHHPYYHRKALQAYYDDKKNKKAFSMNKQQDLIMDLKIKMGQQTSDLIEEISNILNCNFNCQTFQISETTPSSTLTKDGIVSLGSLYFNDKAYDFVKHFASLFENNKFNHQMGYLHQLKVEKDNIKISFKFN